MKCLLLALSSCASLAWAIGEPTISVPTLCPPHVTLPPAEGCGGYCTTWIEPVTVGKVNVSDVVTKTAYEVTTVPTSTVAVVTVISYLKPKVGAACRETVESPVQMTVWATSTQTAYDVSTSWSTSTSVITGNPEPSCTRNQRLGDNPPRFWPQPHDSSVTAARPEASRQPINPPVEEDSDSDNTPDFSDEF